MLIKAKSREFWGSRCAARCVAAGWLPVVRSGGLAIRVACGGGSEEAADHAGIAGTQSLQAAQGFLGSTVRCGMVKETVERF